MAFVIDASVTLSWCFRDERSEYAVNVLRRLADDSAIVPDLWALEVANGLLTAERRGRLTSADIAAVHAMLARLPIVRDGLTLDGALGAVVDLARAHNLSAYDAAYLELAMREGLSLATEDARLRLAAQAVGTALIP